MNRTDLRCKAVSSAHARLTDAAAPAWFCRPGGEDGYQVSRTGQSAKGGVGADDNGFELDPLDDLDDYDLEQGPLLNRCSAAMRAQQLSKYACKKQRLEVLHHI